MTYKWKTEALYPVSADVAGRELERIYTENGELQPEQIVDASRPTDAPLHPCFEWNDTIAAEQWRKQQARVMTCNITVQVDATDSKPHETRAFVNVQSSYRPIRVVLNNETQRQELLQTAMREMISFRNKYNTLSQLQPVFDSIDDFVREENAG